MFEKRENKLRVDFPIIAGKLKASSVSPLRLKRVGHKVRWSKGILSAFCNR